MKSGTVTPNGRVRVLADVDLYLIHWPEGGPTWAWPRMEKARELGLARSIGVSNFGTRKLEEVTAAGTVPRPSTRFSSVRWSTGVCSSTRSTEPAALAAPLNRGSDDPDPGCYALSPKRPERKSISVLAQATGDSASTR